MENLIYSVISLVLVALGGWWVIFYKRNKRRLRCIRMKRHLVTHLSNGIPSDYFIDAFERKFPKITVEEGRGIIKIKDKDVHVASVLCRCGILKATIYSFTPDYEDIIKFFQKFSGHEEWRAVSSLMNCGGYCKI